MCGGLLWIPAALSTLRPATSPRLSAIRLRLVSRSTLDRAAEALLRDAGGDLRWFAEELARIEREFEGAVNLTLFWGPGFKAVFDALNVRPRSCEVNDTPTDSFLADPSGLRLESGSQSATLSLSYSALNHLVIRLAHLYANSSTLSGTSFTCGNGELQF